jgi:leucyl aminopeptidase
LEIKVSAGNIADLESDAVVIAVFEETERLQGTVQVIDGALGGEIAEMMKRGEIKGKFNQTAVIRTLGKLKASRVVVAGLGKSDDLTVEKIRQAIAGICRLLRKQYCENVAVVPLGVGVSGIAAAQSAQAIAEGALLGAYEFRRHLTKEPEFGEIKQLVIVDADENNVSALEQGLNKGRILAEATNFARDMVNEPSNFMTPADMANAAAKLAETYGLEVSVLERERMAELGMGGLLGVAQGSQQPPKFIVLNYKEGDSDGIDIALVGKGITFDSGGISIKPSSGMEDMKGDMAGGASVIAAMGAIARLKPRINVLALIPATENLPSGTALKPGDVIRPMGGKTVEIISTDAEGRLILADALGYANQHEAKLIVDIATLTGAMQVALGDICTGAFANNQKLADRVIAAGAEAGERIWQMPMYEDYKEANKSSVADVKNVGGRLAGSITAAQFLSEFVGDTAWVHLDIAGTSMTDKTKGYLVKGATGVPVRTLVNLVLSLSK